MFVLLDFVVGIFGDILGFILNLKIPTGEGNLIPLKSIFIFLFLMRLSWLIIKIFLTKGFMEFEEYDRQSRRDRIFAFRHRNDGKD